VAWLTIAQAAEHIGVAPSTVRAMVKDGRLTAHRLGPRVVRLSSEEIDGAMRSTDDDQ
jgi:excisionase family DNA binding protein